MFPPSLLPPTPPLWVTEPRCESPEIYSKFPLAVYLTYGNISFHVTLSIQPTLSVLPWPHVPKSVLYVYVATWKPKGVSRLAVNLINS